MELDHKDPLHSELVCGLDNELNRLQCNRNYNARKNNRFVPYRIQTWPAPDVFGDVGEFLVEGKWVVCEFGGQTWWKESNRLGNGTVKGGKNSVQPKWVCVQNGKKAAVTNLASGQVKKAGQASRRANSKPVLLTRQSDGHVFWFPALRRACSAFPELNRNYLRDVANEKQTSHRGWTCKWWEA